MDFFFPVAALGDGPVRRRVTVSDDTRDWPIFPSVVGEKEKKKKKDNDLPRAPTRPVQWNDTAGPRRRGSIGVKCRACRAIAHVALRALMLMPVLPREATATRARRNDTALCRRHIAACEAKRATGWRARGARQHAESSQRALKDGPILRASAPFA
jgi:hypothetical protein